MNYKDFIEVYLNKPEELLKRLKGSTKDAKLHMYQDYYDGKQWRFDKGTHSETRFSRSGKEMWKPFDKKRPAKGYTEGELKTWNIIKPAVNIYAKYTRGDDRDDVKIVVKKGKNADKELSNKAMAMFDDLNIFTLDAVKKVSIDSVVIIKFTPLTGDGEGQYDKTEKEILKKIRLEADSENLEAIIELIRPSEIEPLYWEGDNVRGMIRYYVIDKVVAKEQYGIKNLKKDPLYIEAWFIDEDGEVKLVKFVNDYVVEEVAKAPYDFVPYRIYANERSTRNRFDCNHLEESDVCDLVDLQDDMNAFVTDLGVIYRQVAIPMLKITDEFIKNAKNKDINKVKQNIQEITTYAGQILFAPIEKVRSEGVADSQVRHLQDIREQYYTVTSIPRSVFNSEGLANIAAKTLEHLFESLAKVIGMKRTVVSKVYEDSVKMFLMYRGSYDKNISIETVFPNMFGNTTEYRFEVIRDSFAQGALPIEYVLELILELLGDSERYEEVKDWLIENQDELKQATETSQALQFIRQAANAPENQNAANEQTNQRNRDLAEANGNNTNENRQDTRNT